jgi:hypothetical protein
MLGRSMMMTATQHRKWLMFTAIGIAAFGPLCTLATMPGLAEPARLALDLLAWPIDGAQSFADPTARFLSALAGGFLIGWGVTLWCVARHVHPLAPEPVRRAVVAGLLGWFVVDSAGSIAAGFPINVAFNTLTLLILVGPLWWPARAAG